MPVTKTDVKEWISALMPYIINPVILAPKGAMSKGLKNAKPGDVVEYDTCLIPETPMIIDRTPALKILVGLYSLAEDEYYTEGENEKAGYITLEDEEDDDGYPIPLDNDTDMVI